MSGSYCASHSLIRLDQVVLLACLIWLVRCQVMPQTCLIRLGQVMPSNYSASPRLIWLGEVMIGNFRASPSLVRLGQVMPGSYRNSASLTLIRLGQVMPGGYCAGPSLMS